MRIKAEELPSDLIAAFVDALEAWTVVEHDHFMIHQFLARPSTLDQGWEAFTELNPRQQRDSTSEMVEQSVRDAETKALWARLYKRITRLAQKRNRLAHGRWHKIELMSGSKTTGFEYLRLYEGRGAGVSRPTNEREAEAELSKTRFYSKEMRTAEREFLELARDLHRFIEPLINSVRATQTRRSPDRR